MRVGIGYDSHRLVPGRKLILGGVEIPHSMGLKGHSDADVLTHSIIDALLGASGRGDIGRMFPDTDPKWKDARSLDMLAGVVASIRGDGLDVGWIDCVVITEQPKISPHVEDIRQSLSTAGIPPGVINVKAKTNEGMGFTGRGEGMAAISTCLLVPCADAGDQKEVKMENHMEHQSKAQTKAQMEDHIK